MTVQPIAPAGTPIPVGGGTPARGDAGAFADVLARELGAAAPRDPVATPISTAPAVASTPVTFGQMLGMAGAPGDASIAAAAQLAAGPAAAPAAAAPATPAGLVVPVEGRFSSPFGMRTHPVTGVRKMHTGVDIAAPTGTPIRSAAGGTVSFAGVRGGYGNVVIVDHPDGSQTYYAHQNELRVRAGDRVAAGEVVGTVGSTGMSTGPHLHFELRRGGEPVDPAPLLGLRR